MAIIEPLKENTKTINAEKRNNVELQNFRAEASFNIVFCGAKSRTEFRLSSGLNLWHAGMWANFLEDTFTHNLILNLLTILFLGKAVVN